MSESIFDGMPLLSGIPRYATLDEVFRSDDPTGARFRTIVDGWVAGDTAAERAKVRADLLKPGTSVGTWHELLLRQILRQNFGVVQRTPPGLPVRTKTPDFGVSVGRRERIVVFESSSISEKVDQETHKLRAVARRLDRIDGPWHLIPQWRGSQLDSVPPKVVEAAVRKEIEGLEPGNHELEIPLGGDVVFRATLIPASRHRESIVSMDIPIGGYSFGVKAIGDDIKEKTARYRGLQAGHIPFILAVGTGTDPGLIDWGSMFGAMYGQEQVTVTFRDAQPVAMVGSGLDFSGRVTPKQGSEPRHRTLSAAWLVRWRLRSNDLRAEVVHFPNPWAANPVRIYGRDISRVTFRWVEPGRVAELRPPRRLREIAVT